MANVYGLSNKGGPKGGPSQPSYGVTGSCGPTDYEEAEKYYLQVQHTKHTMHPVLQGGDCVIWIDEERAKIIVRAPFNADFVTLCRYLQGKNFVKKEEERGGVKKVFDKYWEFDLGPNNLRELLRILKLCYKQISMPPLELLSFWEMLEVEDMEIIYKLLITRCTDDKVKDKIDKFFKKHIDLSKQIIRAGRRIELSNEDE